MHGLTLLHSLTYSPHHTKIYTTCMSTTSNRWKLRLKGNFQLKGKRNAILHLFKSILPYKWSRNLLYFPNKSDPKLKPKITCSLSPSHASGSLYNFILSLSCTLRSFFNKFCLTHYPALAVANGHLKTPVF